MDKHTHTHKQTDRQTEKIQKLSTLFLVLAKSLGIRKLWFWAFQLVQVNSWLRVVTPCRDMFNFVTRRLTLSPPTIFDKFIQNTENTKRIQLFRIL